MNGHCRECNKLLIQDERAICKKLVSRDVQDYLCIACLAQFFRCHTSIIYKRIDQFKKMGCAIFSTSAK